MPRGQPGEETYQPEVSPEDFPRKLTPRLSGENIGPALGQLAGAYEAKQKADSATWAGDQLATFRVNAAHSLEAMKAALPAGDPGNFTEQYLSKFDKDAEPLVGVNSPHPYAAHMMENGLRQMREQFALHSMEWEAVQRKTYQNDSLQHNLDQQLPLVRQHPQMADAVGQSLLQQNNATVNDPAEKVRFARHMDTQLTYNASMGLVDQNPGEVYRQLTTNEVKDPTLARLIDPVARTEVLKAAQAGLIKNFAEGALNAYRTGGPSAGQQAYAAVDQLTLPGPQSQQDAIKDDIRASIQKRRGELIAEQQQKLGPEALAVEESLRSGAPTPGTRARIWDLYHNNALDPHTTGAYLGALDAAERKLSVDMAGIQLVQDAWNGKYLLDPKDHDQKDDAGNWFDSVASTNKLPQGSQGWVNLASEFARRTGMIPVTVGDWSRSVLVGSQDPKQVMAAADAVTRVRDAAPRSFQYFEDDHKIAAMADSITNMTKAGVDPTQAIALARENAERAVTDRTRLEQMWKTQKPLGPDNKAVDSVLEGQIHDDPKLAELHWYHNSVPLRPPQMQAEYETLVHQYFDHNGGNATQAEASAARDLGNVWGLTRMNGDPEIVKYPPERMFRAPDGGPGLRVEDIRSDVEKAVQQHPEAFQRWDEGTRALATFHVKPEQVHIIQTPATALTNGRQWGLAYQGDDGVLEALYGKNGKPLEYTVPVAAGDYKAARDAQVQKATAAADARYQERKRQEERALKLLQEDATNFRGVP